MPTLAINATSSGTNTLLAAQGSGKYIHVLGYAFVVEGAVTAKWNDGSTDYSGAMSFAAAGDGIVVPQTGPPIFGCGDNKPLILTLGGAVAVRGHLNYVIREVPV